MACGTNTLAVTLYCAPGNKPLVLFITANCTLQSPKNNHKYQSKLAFDTLIYVQHTYILFQITSEFFLIMQVLESCWVVITSFSKNNSFLTINKFILGLVNYCQLRRSLLYIRARFKK